MTRRILTPARGQTWVDWVTAQPPAPLAPAPLAPAPLPPAPLPPISHRTILAIAVPIMVSNASTPLLGLVDLAAVGRIGGAAPIVAVALGGLVFTAVFGASTSCAWRPPASRRSPSARVTPRR